MIKVKLPDGTIKEVAKGTNSLDIAKSISEGLARKVLAAEINGEVWDAASLASGGTIDAGLFAANARGPVKNDLFHGNLC